MNICKRIVIVGILFLANGVVHATTPGTVKWSFDVQGMINYPVGVGKDGTIYVASQDQHIWAINPDGTKKWAFPTTYYPLGTPLVHTNGNIYFAENGPNLNGQTMMVAIKPDGTQLWASDESSIVPGGQYALLSPVENKGNGDMLVSLTLLINPFTGVQSTTDYLLGVNSINGTTIVVKTNLLFTMNNTPIKYFRTPFADQNNGIVIISQISEDSPIMPDGNYLLFCNMNTANHSMDEYTCGSFILNPTPDVNHQLSSVSGNNQGIIYFGDSLGNLAAYSDVDYHRVWIAKLGGDISHAAPTIDSKGNILVGSSNGYLYNAAPDGTINWSVGIDPAGISKEAALDPDGTIYVTADSGNVFAVDPMGKIKWTQASNATTAPVVGPDGTVYVGNAFNEVVAINGESHGLPIKK